MGRIGRSPAKMLPRKKGITALSSSQAVEVVRNCSPEFSQCCGQVGGLGFGRRLSGGCACRNSSGAEKEGSPFCKESPASLSNRQRSAPSDPPQNCSAK